MSKEERETLARAASDLPIGWCRDERGALRRDTCHSMLRRMVGWNYRERAIYEITVVLADRASQALGRLEVKLSPEDNDWLSIDEARRIVGRGSGPKARVLFLARVPYSPTVSASSEHSPRVPYSPTVSPRTVLARVAASEIGEAVANCWEAIPRFYPQIKILSKQLMPDHFHGVLFVTAPLGCHLGQVIKGFKTGCNKAARELGLLSPGVGLFSEGFNDSILFHEGQLGNWFNYLRDNPRRLALKLLFADLFRRASDLAVSVAASSVLADSVGESTVLAASTVLGDSVAENRTLAEYRTLAHFSSIGNRFLLDRPLVQIQVSRRDFGYRRERKTGGGLKISRDAAGEPLVEFSTPAFEAKRETLFSAAKHGAVLISPCISDGERQLAREALAAGLRLVTLQNKGFAPLQKPTGRLFDACVEGRLLMLAPAAWPYLPGEKPMTRFDAVAMNRLCQWLAGPGAAAINYHGMKPDNIDALARAAAKVEP